ncbi:HlyD family secretion protein [Myxococcota bacterium]|nr:HlyD family secretion protein [Myxococcota bacterium]
MSDTTAHRDLEASSLLLVRGPDALQIFTRILYLVMGATVLALFIVPWQQNIPASGHVSALDPFDRIQTIAAPVSGRVLKSWVQEGTRVKEGDPLLEIVDLDPEMIPRLGQQREALESQLSAAREKVAIYKSQVDALTRAQDLSVQAAQNLVEVAGAKVRSAEHGVEAAQAAVAQAELNFDRQKQLVDEGLASTLEFEVADRLFKQAKAELSQDRQALTASLEEEKARGAELGRIKTEAQARIESARAEVQVAEAEAAGKQQDLATLSVRIAQQNAQRMTAPRSGTVFRLYASPGAELVKAGDPLVALLPDAQSQAVELWVDGNDVPLIHEGRSVRLQFEGWPGVQFGGWPSVAVGTFGGEVAVVDSSGDGQGRFRILVVPDPKDDPWPSPQYLRQGARANGFVLLDQVAIGYELWRQANGFPPTVAMDTYGAPGAAKRAARDTSAGAAGGANASKAGAKAEPGR